MRKMIQITVLIIFSIHFVKFIFKICVTVFLMTNYSGEHKKQQQKMMIQVNVP